MTDHWAEVNFPVDLLALQRLSRPIPFQARTLQDGTRAHQPGAGATVTQSIIARQVPLVMCVSRGPAVGIGAIYKGALWPDKVRLALPPISHVADGSGADQIAEIEVQKCSEYHDAPK